MQTALMEQKKLRMRQAKTLLLALLAMAVGFGAGAQLQRQYSDQRVAYWMLQAFHAKAACTTNAPSPADSH